ncbi:MAG: helix-turn-helix domain-containing protein [Dehalococcoidia bacterium]
MSPDSTLAGRATIHAALADPGRLAICDELAWSDRSPSELAERLGIRSNLLAHHLLVLARAGLVETTRSAGDGRRRYVHLRHEVLSQVAPYGPPVAPVRPVSVLFVCSANSARSLLAAALWRARSDVPALSAGITPAARVHPQAEAAAQRHGLDLAGAVPRPIEAVEEAPGLIVTVCDEAHEALAPREVPSLHWSVPDPARAGTRTAFDRAVEALQRRVELLSRAVQTPVTT